MIKERDHSSESVQYSGGRGSRGVFVIPYPLVYDSSAYSPFYVAYTELRFLTGQLKGNYQIP